MAGPLVEIDGSLGEGGGQILRSSLALSLLTGKPFHLSNIRARRARPGLQPQHLMCVRAAAEVGQGQLRGASKDSTDLVFEPGTVTAGKYTFSIGTAGATSLVLHTLYLPLALKGDVPSELTITGGTHVPMSPAFHFLDTTWRGYMELLGLKIKLRMPRPGFYPRGGGVLEAHLQPCPRLYGLHLEPPPTPTRASGFSAVAGLPEDIAARQARRAARRLKDRFREVDIREETWPGGPGTVLAVTLETAPVPTLFFGLGERGKRAERVADEAADEALAHVKGERGVDVHSADQLILPLAMASGASSYPVTRITQHLLTNIAVIRYFLERDIQVEGVEGGPGWVRVA